MNNSSVEHRISQRTRTLPGAKVFFNEGKSVFYCVVKNLSETGALTHIENSLAVPPKFSLRLSDDRLFECQVIWRKANSLGVQFEAAH